MDLFKLLTTKKKTGRKNLWLLILGLDNSGKTSILKSLMKEDIKEINPTQGFNVKSLLHQVDELAGIPLLVFANKQDIFTSMEPEEIVEELKLD